MNLQRNVSNNGWEKCSDTTADYCLIYRNINNKDQMKLQKYLNLLEKWGNTWGMSFNPSQRTILRVSRTRDPNFFNNSLIGQVLEEVMDDKYVGVTLSDDLELSNISQP